VKLIGENYAGILTHDGWAPYLRFAKAILKQSLALRDRRDAGQLAWASSVEPGSPTSAEPSPSEPCTPTPVQAAEAGWMLQRQIETLTSRPRDDAEQERFARHLWKHLPHLFTFLAFEGVDATNHRAEQALRPAVVNRKVWGGNRTDAGAAAQSILMSVLRAAAQRGIDALTFLSDMLKATLGQEPQLLRDTG
jgi:transposase